MNAAPYTQESPASDSGVTIIEEPVMQQPVIASRETADEKHALSVITIANPSTADTTSTVEVETMPRHQDTTKRSWLQQNVLTVNVFTTPTSLVLSIGTSIVVMLYALAYLGVLWDPQSRLPHVRVGFVNADAGFDFSSTPPPLAAAITAQFKNRTMGQVIQSTLLAPDTPSRNALDWIDLTSENLSHQDAIDRVERNEFWNIVYIPANASNVFLRNFNLDGRPSSKLTYMYIEDIYDQARQLTVASFTTGAVNSIFRGFGAAFNEKLLAGINTPNATVTVNPITFFVSGTNIHPVRFFGLNFATYIICLVLWLSGLITMGLMTTIYEAGLVRLREFNLVGHLRTPLRIVMSVQFASLLASFFHALTAWGIYCAFNNSATSGFNPDYSSFTVLMYMWFITVAFHTFATFLAINFGKDNFGLPMSLLLIFQLATSSSILDPDIMPPFAHVTYGLPFHYAVRSMKCMLLSSSCHDMGKNTGVLTAWLVGMVALTLLTGRGRVVARRNQMFPESKTQ
ncbi:hypothetical protein BC831DRAFT_475747 [Entophlyctis helioformis]|nr:hypothetical protein BC831DRAFT_475747 [Entophlyctis helioformis]